MGNTLLNIKVCGLKKGVLWKKLEVDRALFLFGDLKALFWPRNLGL
jgi:hypothetical protein